MCSVVFVEAMDKSNAAGVTSGEIKSLAKIAALAANMVEAELWHTLEFVPKNAGLILEQIEEVQSKNTGAPRLMSARRSPL